MTLPEQKRALREQQRRLLAAMSPGERTAASAALCDQLERAAIWREARTVLAFVARADEPDLGPLLRAGLVQGKIVALPRFRAETGTYEAAAVGDWEQDLAPGAYGIPEPSARCPALASLQLDLVLVPGLAFAADGARLGRGLGYYDRLLSGVGGHRCGVLFEWQQVGSVPVEPHDRFMNSILTPACWREAAR